MPFRYRFDWEFELLTPDTLMTLLLQATAITYNAALTCMVDGNPNELSGILNTAADGWEVIIRLFKIQNPKLAHLV